MQFVKFVVPEQQATTEAVVFSKNPVSENLGPLHTRPL